VLYGDSWLQTDPGAVYRAASESGRPALMTVFDNHDRWDRSNVVFHDGLVERYEKDLAQPPADMTWIDYGLSVLTRDVLAEHVAPGGRADLAPLLSRLAAEGRLAGFPVAERFYEIGSPEGLAELDALLGSLGAAPDLPS
jgi:NDP-sugar pyrophosphorylase family protein